MLSLRGSSALSPFRLDKILATLKATAPRITRLHAEFRHFAWTDGSLTSNQQETLEKILTYGPKMTGGTATGELFLVIPRPGTISPWSTRATEIARHCGIENMIRLERGIAFYADTVDGAPLTENEKQVLKPLIHDRMTEAVFSSLDDAERLYHTAEPAPMNSIDILGGGRQALETANTEMGLALSPDEVDYLMDNFTRMGRNPTDVSS